MQKAIDEAMKFVCTTSARIVKDTKEFIQNVDWKKVAIGIGATIAVTAVVVATGGAAAPVLIGAAVGAGISTGTTIVSGAIHGKSPAEIAQDASGAFMWGAIGGAVGGGTTQILGKVGTKTLGKVGQKLVEDGVDITLDLAQTASENGGLTGQDILLCAATSFGGELLSSVKTPSTLRNQLIDGATDNRAVKNATKADFYVKPNGDAVPSTGYRYISKTNDALDDIKNTMTIHAKDTGTYFSFDDFSSPNPGALQVPHDASVKVSFDTLQVIDDIEIPKGQWGTADCLEPITKDYLKYGPGGATQAIIHQQISVDSITYLK